MVPQCYASEAPGGERRERKREMKPITSRRNALVARYRAIARGDEPALLLLDGAHLVAAALAAGVGVRQAVVAAGDLGRGDLKALVDDLARKRVEVLTASASVMDALSPLRSSSVIVAYGVPSMSWFSFVM